MEAYSNLKKLIDWAEKFDRQLLDGQKWDDKNFASWLDNEVNTAKYVDSVLPEKPKPSLAMAVYFMYKYALFYSRKIFKKSQIYSLDDFSFLASLLPDKKLKKAEVIRKNVAEKSSGNEVLKRLLKQKLIQETNNPDDKRSKLLEITPEGFNEINAVRTQMYKMSSLVDGDLTEQEKTTMLTMLSKLHKFHNPLFEANDELVLNEKLGIEN
jgi:DNA-binding MarR family transcriptional regulator